MGHRDLRAYTCLRCKKVGAFYSAHEAFEAGWDVAPYFTLSPLCPDCPTVPFISRRDGARSVLSEGGVSESDNANVSELKWWWDRLSQERPLSGRESVRLQNFLALLIREVRAEKDRKRVR